MTTPIDGCFYDADLLEYYISRFDHSYDDTGRRSGLPDITLNTTSCWSETTMPPPEHRSFCLTPPAYMKASRVKRRLRVLAYVSYLIALLVMFISEVVTVSVIAEHRADVAWGYILFWGVPLATGFVSLMVCKVLFIWRRMMTHEEARDFPLRLCSRWPDSWLEPETAVRQETERPSEDVKNSHN